MEEGQVEEVALPETQLQVEAHLEHQVCCISNEMKWHQLDYSPPHFLSMPELLIHSNFHVKTRRIPRNKDCQRNNLWPKRRRRKYRRIRQQIRTKKMRTSCSNVERVDCDSGRLTPTPTITFRRTPPHRQPVPFVETGKIHRIIIIDNNNHIDEYSNNNYELHSQVLHTIESEGAHHASHRSTTSCLSCVQ